MVTNINDFQEVQEFVALLLKKYKHKDDPMPKWVAQGTNIQMQHVRGHLDSITLAQREVPLSPKNFEDFVSLACRAEMLLWHAIIEFPKEAAAWLETTREPKV